MGKMEAKRFLPILKASYSRKTRTYSVLFERPNSTKVERITENAMFFIIGTNRIVFNHSDISKDGRSDLVTFSPFIEELDLFLLEKTFESEGGDNNWFSAIPQKCAFDEEGVYFSVFLQESEDEIRVRPSDVIAFEIMEGVYEKIHMTFPIKATLSGKDSSSSDDIR